MNKPRMAAFVLNLCAIQLHSEPTPSIDACSQPVDDHFSSPREKKTDAQQSKARPLMETDLPIFNDRRLEEVASLLNWSSSVAVKMANVSDSGWALICLLR